MELPADECRRRHNERLATGGVQALNDALVEEVRLQRYNEKADGYVSIYFTLPYQHMCAIIRVYTCLHV